MSAGSVWLLVTVVACALAVTSWAIGRATGYRAGQEHAERRAARRARSHVGDALAPRDRAEHVRIVRYPEPLWPKTKETSRDL